MHTPSSSTSRNSQVMRWFQQARFGLFIHWGLYALPARGEWYFYKEEVPWEDYRKLADQFVPAQFDADAWVEQAQRAGARYMVLTARHHDGFCLYDSQVSDFTSVKSRARRDFVAEYVAACRRAGMRIGLYYSLMDWRYPGTRIGSYANGEFECMVQQAHDQVRELLTQYGTIDLLWYDGIVKPEMDAIPVAQQWRSAELNAMARALQPNILINDRSGLPEDFTTPEQYVIPPDDGRAWEACMTIGTSWGYCEDDCPLKSPREIIRQLVSATSAGGNFLLNIGPRADGTIQPEFVERLDEVGRWLRLHGEAIYDTEGKPYSLVPHPLGMSSGRTRHLYHFLFDWPGSYARIAGHDLKVDKVRLLNTDVSLVATPTGDGTVEITGLPDTAPDAIANVIAIDLKQPASNVRPVPMLETVPFPPELPQPAPIMTVTDLQSCTRVYSASESWCPGWRDTRVLDAKDSVIAFDLDIPTTGRQTIEIGIVSTRATIAQVHLSSPAVDQVHFIEVAGYPCTLSLPPLMLHEGRISISIQLPNTAFGIYGVRVNPVWRSLPAETWMTIGPFPSAFTPHAGDQAIRTAMDTPYLSEEAYHPDVCYLGIDNTMVRWQHAGKCHGTHALCGIDFVECCSIPPYGICYAYSEIWCPDQRSVDLLIGCDWWARAYVNSERLTSTRQETAVLADGADFNGNTPIQAQMHLHSGRNTLLIKCHGGTTLNWFTCYLTDADDLRCQPPAH